MRSGVRRTALTAAGVAGYAAARRWFLTWGATTGEAAGALPGDDLLASATVTTTRAVTIDAPPEHVWPWLVQMGQDRGGLYSYDWLENLFGLDFRNADRIHPEWQQLAVGDQFRAAPVSAGPEAGFTVVAIDPGVSIVTAVGDPARVVPLASHPPMTDGGTWTFVLRRASTGRTRLVVRMRMRLGSPPVAEWLSMRLLEPVHFVMERKQLLGIKHRAEAAESDVPDHIAPVAA